jgi:hypothetical protein
MIFTLTLPSPIKGEGFLGKKRKRELPPPLKVFLLYFLSYSAGNSGA